MHPGVREAAVVGAPDPVRGEVPVAYLVADETVDDEAVREQVEARAGVVQAASCVRAHGRAAAYGARQSATAPAAPVASLSEPLRSIERLRSRRPVMRRLAALAVAGLALAASTTLRAQSSREVHQPAGAPEDHDSRRARAGDARIRLEPRNPLPALSRRRRRRSFEVRLRLDAKPAKSIARRMLKMVTALNEKVAGIGEPAPAGAPKITCFTCHRGA